MRLLWANLAIGSIILAFPMLLMTASRLVFRLYANTLPISLDHPHVQASLQSIQAIGLEVFCLFPMTGLVPSLCIDSSPSHASLPMLCRVGLEQHVLYQALVRNAPTPHVIDLVSSIRLAAHAAMDDLLLSCDGGEIGMEGRADELMYISSAAGNISAALHDVLVHIELSIARSVVNPIISAILPDALAVCCSCKMGF